MVFSSSYQYQHFTSRVDAGPPRAYTSPARVAMAPWVRDDIVVCDTFEYMVRRLVLLASSPFAPASRFTYFPPPPTAPHPRDRASSQETTTFATTGGHVWQAAHRLAEYLEAVVSDVGLDRPGAKILELGAGTGWLSMVLARNLPDADRVVATGDGIRRRPRLAPT